MFFSTYDKEEKRVERARKQVLRDFALQYGKIQKSDLSESEKQARIDDLIKRTNDTDEILTKTKNLSELSSEDKEALGIKEENEPVADEKVIDTLVSIFATRAKMPKERINVTYALDGITLSENEALEDIDTSAFEEELRQFFTEHYYDLLDTGYNEFLSTVTEVPDEEIAIHREYGDLVKLAIKHNLDPEKFSCFGYKFTVQEGLVAEEDSTLGTSNVFYATPEGINRRIYDLYSQTLYQEQRKKDKDLFSCDTRELKNTYITYAEKHGIEIKDRDVLEEIPVDMKKVQGIASYLNRVLNEQGIISTDMTEQFAAEIQKDYSKIMNLTSFNFGKLETVEQLTNGEYVPLHLSINEDSILKTDELRPDIAYATPEYVRDKYKIVMKEIKELSCTDAFFSGYFDVEKANRQKEVLRRYIIDNGIEGIDITIPEVEIDHKKTEMIADAILAMYGEKCENKEEMRARILKRVEDRYPEMFYERQVIELNDLVGEELKDMGKAYVTEKLYMQKDFVYIGDETGFNGECIYATQEAIIKKIGALDDTISRVNSSYREKRIREQLVQYAKDNNLKIQTPDIESVENEKQRQLDRFSFRDSGLGPFDRMLPNDPTARQKIELKDSTLDVIYKISEGIPGAIVGMAELMKSDSAGFMLLLGLDDMNIRGSQIWIAYKYLYKEDGKKFKEAVRKRDSKMIDFINEMTAAVGEEKAVSGGASFDRSENPSKYRFTQEDVEKFRTQKEERLKKEKEIRDKLIANSTAKKKTLGQKNREERERKKREYREKLLAKGKKSISELDAELTDLQSKEKQAKELAGQYEEQLPDKPAQDK